MIKTAKVDSKFEAKLVVQALRINTLSKLTFSDCARFNALMKDVFPGIEFKDIEYEELATAIRSVCEETNLKVNEVQVRKCRNFSTVLWVHHLCFPALDRRYLVNWDYFGIGLYSEYHILQIWTVSLSDGCTKVKLYGILWLSIHDRNTDLWFYQTVHQLWIFALIFECIKTNMHTVWTASISEEILGYLTDMLFKTFSRSKRPWSCMSSWDRGLVWWWLAPVVLVKPPCGKFSDRGSTNLARKSKSIPWTLRPCTGHR